MKFGHGVRGLFCFCFFFCFFVSVGNISSLPICASVEEMLLKLSKCDNGDCKCNGGYHCPFCDSAITKQSARKESAIKHLKSVSWKHYSTVDSISTSSYQIVHKNMPRSRQIDSRHIQHYYYLCCFKKIKKHLVLCKNKQMEFIEETEADPENKKVAINT